MTDNPLLNAYSLPGMYISLPSGGRFYDHDIKLTADGELEILPMNAIDELQFQNPDGLLNNESLIKVLQRTVPGISHPGEIPKPDLDVILLALRMVTYGKNMSVESSCRQCKHKANYSVDLTGLLANTGKIPEENSVDVRDMTVYVKPYSLESQNRLNEFMINIQRTARQLQARGASANTDAELIEELKEKMGNSVRESATELFVIASNSIQKIVLADGTTVSDKKHISEWLDKIKAPDYKIIREKIAELSEEVLNRNMKFVCEECGHENSAEVNFDPANFFDLN